LVQKFGTYDFLANLVPGLALLWTVHWLSQFLGIPNFIPATGSLAETLVLIAWAFLSGLLIQGIAQGVIEKVVLRFSGGFPSARWLLEGEPGLSPEYRSSIKDAIADYFGVPVEPNVSGNLKEKEARKARLRRYQELFYLCYNLVDQKKLSERPLAFNAHYGLFRALFTLFLILLILFSFVAIRNWQAVSQQDRDGFFLSVIVFFFVASIISFFRMKKRSEDFVKCVYDLFFTFYRQEKVAEKK